MDLSPSDLASAAFTFPAPEVTDSGLIVVRRNVVPWADLDALDRPDYYLSAQKELLPVIAVMAAQAGTNPKLVASDDLGRLLLAGPVNPFTTLTAAVPADGNAFPVSSTASFVPGDYFIVIPGPNRAQSTDPAVFQVASLTGTQLTGFSATRHLTPYAIGDLVVKLPRNYQPNQVPIKGSASWAANAPAAATQAKVSFTLVAGQTGYILAAYWEVRQSGTTATAVTATVQDQVPTLYFQTDLVAGITANTVDRFAIEDAWLPIVGSAGMTVSIGFSAAGAAGTFERIAAAWLVV